MGHSSEDALTLLSRFCSDPYSWICGANVKSNDQRLELPVPYEFIFPAKTKFAGKLSLRNEKTFCHLIFDNIEFIEEVDLDFSINTQSILFRQCTFKKGISAKLASFGQSFYLTDCEVDPLTRDDNFTLNLRSSRIQNQCDLSGSNFHGDINLTRLSVGNSLLIRLRKESYRQTVIDRDLIAPDLSINKLCDLAFIHVAGRIDLDRCQIGSSLSFMDRRVIEGGEPFQLSKRGPFIGSKLSLRGSSIGQTFDLRGGKCSEIDLTNSKINGHLRLDQNPAGINTIIKGRLSLDGADVGGNVNFDNISVAGGITAEHIKVGGSWTLQTLTFQKGQRRPVIGIVENEGYKASLWAIYAQIGGSLVMNGMVFKGAVNLARCVIRNNWYIQKSSDEAGPSCRIGKGHLTVAMNKPYSQGNSEWTGLPSPPSYEAVSLYAAEAQVTGSLYWTHLSTLDAPVIVEGISCFQIKLSSSSIFNDVVDFTGSTIHNDLDIRFAQFKKGLYLTSVSLSGNLMGSHAVFGRIGKQQTPREWFLPNNSDTSATDLWQYYAAQFPSPSLSLVNASILGYVDLQGALLRGPLNCDFIECSSTIILDSVSRSKITTIGPGYHPNGYAYSLSLNGAVIRGGLFGRSTQFGGAVDLSMATITGDLNLGSHIDTVPTRIKGTVCHNMAGPHLLGLWLRAANFGGQIQLRGITASGGLCMVDCKVHGTVDLHRSTIGYSKHRLGSRFSLDARSSVVTGPLRASGAFFAGDVLLTDSDIAGIQLQAFRRSTPQATIVVGNLLGSYTTYDGSVNLTGLFVTGGIDLRYCTINGNFEMQGVDNLRIPDGFSSDRYQYRRRIAAAINSKSVIETDLTEFTDENYGELATALAISYLRISQGEANSIATYCGVLTNQTPSEVLSLCMEGATIHGALQAGGTIFRSAVNLRSIHVMGGVSLVNGRKDSEERYATFIGAGTQSGRVFSLRLSNGVIDSHIEISGLRCKSAVTMSNAKVSADLKIHNSEFQDGLWSSDDKVRANVLMDLMRAGGDVSIKLKLVASGGISLKGATVGKDLKIQIEQDLGETLAHQIVNSCRTSPELSIHINTRVLSGSIALTIATPVTTAIKTIWIPSKVPNVSQSVGVSSMSFSKFTPMVETISQSSVATTFGFAVAMVTSQSHCEVFCLADPWRLLKSITLYQDKEDLSISGLTEQEYFIDLTRSKVPGTLDVPLRISSERWINLSQVSTGRFMGTWIGGVYPSGLLPNIQRWFRDSLNPESEIFFCVDYLDFQDIGFSGLEFKNVDIIDTLLAILVGSALFAMWAIIWLIGVSSNWEIYFVPMTFTIYSFLFWYRLVRRGSSRSGESVISAARTLYCNTEVFARHSKFSERFYVRLIDFFASNGFRDQSDRIFRAMKDRELKVDSSFTGVLTNLTIRASTVIGYIVVLAGLFYEVGVCVEDAYLGTPTAWNNSALTKDGLVLPPISPTDALLAPLKHMIPFTKLDELCEVKSEMPVDLPWSFTTAPQVVQPIHNVASRKMTPRNTATVKSSGQSKQQVSVTENTMGLMRKHADAEPLLISVQTSRIKIGYLYVLLSLFGYAGFSALVLSVAGLFRRHRYLGSVE